MTGNQLSPAAVWPRTRDRFRAWMPLITAWFWLLLSTAAAAHPFHVTLGEAEWNQENHHLEVAIKIDPLDLEAALSHFMRRSVRLEDNHRGDKLIVRYLNETFLVKSKDGRIQSLKWLGKELSAKEVWIYFEIEMSTGLQGATVTNRLLFDVQKEQVNTLNLRGDGQRRSLRFSRESPEQQLVADGS